MSLRRGNIKPFVIAIIAFFVLRNEGLGQQYTKVAFPNVTVTPNCAGYYEFLPPGYDANDNTKLYPLIISLHGVGEQKNPWTGVYDISTIVNAPSWYWALPHLIFNNAFPTSFTVAGTSYSFVVMAPQCAYEASPTDLKNYLAYFIANYNIDPDRIFLTGYSHGATRTWAAMSDPTIAQQLKAIIPVAGGAEFSYRYCPTGPATPCVTSGGQISTGEDFNKVVTNLATPGAPKVFAVQGNADANNNFVYNEDYVREINIANTAAGATYFLYTTPPEPDNTGHEGSWNKAYNPTRADFSGRNMYVWMLEQANALLPVTLSAFDAQYKGSEVLLSWTTAAESNSSYFSVERSSNGKDFKEIGRVNASGNSSTTKQYSFTDRAVLSGVSYYRLKMIDKDASFKYSPVRKISTNTSGLEFSIGPNPVSGEAWIRMTGRQKGQLQITVTDLMGRSIKHMMVTKTANELTQTIDLGSLKAGQYILQVRGENINYTTRMVKK